MVLDHRKMVDFLLVTSSVFSLLTEVKSETKGNL